MSATQSYTIKRSVAADRPDAGGHMSQMRPGGPAFTLYGLHRRATRSPGQGRISQFQPAREAEKAHGRGLIGPVRNLVYPGKVSVLATAHRASWQRSAWLFCGWARQRAVRPGMAWQGMAREVITRRSAGSSRPFSFLVTSA